jgi:hypothetical protein
MDLLRSSLYFKRLSLTSQHFSLLAVAFLFSLSLSSQVYFDNGWEYSTYTNEGDFRFDHVQNNYRFTLGFIVYDKEDGLFHTGFDLTNFSRIFHRSIDRINYEYSFRGLELKLFVGLEPMNNLKVDGGVSFASFWTGFEINGDQDPLGAGFSNFDFGLSIRTVYNFHPNLGVGFSAARWLNPMLTHTPIGDFGEFLPDEKWVEAITYNLFVRVQFGKPIAK